MQITNRNGLPQALVNAILADDYNRGAADISVTGLLKPARQTALEALHSDDVTEDAADRLWALYGKIVHHIIEISGGNAIKEERLFAKIGGVTVSGAIDEMEISRDGKALAINDYKFTTVWSYTGGVKHDWERQLNLYAWLLRRNGFDVADLTVTAIYRDWSKLQALRQNDYPPQQVAVFRVKLWEEEYAEAFAAARVEAFLAARARLPECTPEERWEKPTIYAVHKEGRKSAVKLFRQDEHDDAEHAANAGAEALGKGHYVVKRPGESTRCAFYCAVANFCDQHQKALQEG